MTRVWLKDDVYGDLQTPMQKAHGRLVELYAMYGMDFFVTSRNDGKHSPGSLHYVDLAEDFKRQSIRKHLVVDAAGPGFDVVEYPEPRDIYHVEFDPKPKKEK